MAAEQGATPFDTPGAELHHYKEGEDERCSFDAMIRKYGLTDPALEAMAIGFRTNAKDDYDNTRLQFPAYDALYTYCKLKVEGKAKLERAAL